MLIILFIQDYLMKNILIKDVFNLSNSLSILRMLLFIPLLFLTDLNSENQRYYLLAIFFGAYITDILDGYFARKLNQITEMGKIIDPLADKFLMAAVVIKLYSIGELTDLFFWTVVIRDVLIFIGGVFVTKYIGKVLPSNKLGKITVLIIGMFLIIVVTNFKQISLITYKIFYFGSIFMCFASFVGYVIRSVEYVRWKKNETI